jgi:hypothetical protein
MCCDALFGGAPYIIQYSDIHTWKQEGPYAYYLGAGGKLPLWSWAS